ncbi:MAG: phosphodiester glycosidase family protein [Clostridia bacterium]|nr:phosphodiester glycosidase family protein [Clostridia bacterium]
MTIWVLCFVLLATVPVSAGAAETGSLPAGVLAVIAEGPSAVQPSLPFLSDGRTDTTLTLNTREELVLSRAEGETRPIDSLYFDFYEQPGSFVLTFCDADGNKIASQQFNNAELLLRVPTEELQPASIVLTVISGPVRITEAYLCDASFSAPFSDASETADVFILLGSPGDEVFKLGGLPLLLAGEHGLSVRVAYLFGADGYKTHQCMEALRALGVRQEPVFFNATATDATNDTAVWGRFGSETSLLNKLTSLIRTTQPRLLIVPDAAKNTDPYSDGVIGRAALKSAAMAADEQRNVQKLPAHTVDKVYSLTAAGTEGATVVTLDRALFAFDGANGAAMAQSIAELYREERLYRRTVPQTLSFVLQSSAVGEDAAKDALWENLDLTQFSGWCEPTATPAPTATPGPTDTPSPVPAETPAPTEAATAAPAAQPTAVPEEPDEPAESRLWLRLLPGAVAVALFVLFLLLKKKPKWLPVLSAVLLLLCAVLLLRQVRCATPQTVEATVLPTAVPTAAPTATPSAAPTVTPTAAPTETPAPTATPEPTPDPLAAYFTEDGSEEIVSDFTEGHWSYKNDALSIDIVRVNTQYEKNGGPLVYYVADIRMRDYSSFHTNVRSFTQPWRYARLEHAVFALTGDNLTSSEAELKGCLIRNGKYYSDRGAQATLVLNDDLTLEILHPGTFTARQLLDRGVRNTFSFGPVLLENGEVSPEVYTHRVTHPNPRCGVGMIEAGHWIAIATDGRSSSYSMSISLEYFAGLFQSYGCTLAYNLDGGASTGMVFMGEALNLHTPDNNDPQRPWVDCFLLGYSDKVPSVSDPVYHKGER